MIPAFVTGRITHQNADDLLEETKRVNDGSLHGFFSDQPACAEGRQKTPVSRSDPEGLGYWVQPERKGTKGRSPKPNLVPPEELLYAQGVAPAQGSGGQRHF